MQRQHYVIKTHFRVTKITVTRIIGVSW